VKATLRTVGIERLLPVDRMRHEGPVFIQIYPKLRIFAANY